MSCFDQAPEFVDEDNRRFREENPVSNNLMEAKHEALLPPDMVKGKTVLDLGCCLGATGHWCLSHGAAHYTGVEVQDDYVEGARRLLGKYHPGKFTIEQMGIEKWLDSAGTRQFDIVCMLGVIYVFTDYYSILKACAKVCRDILVIEGMYPDGWAQNKDFRGVVFFDNQGINLADIKGEAVGRGTRISPKGLQWLMPEFGFSSAEGVILPRPITDVPDLYNRPLSPVYNLPHDPSMKSKYIFVRYLMRFRRTEAVARSVADDLVEGDIARTRYW